jgi:hypothetical protein
VAQLVAEQVLQKSPVPLVEVDSPPALLEKAAKVEKSFLAVA